LPTAAQTVKTFFMMKLGKLIPVAGGLMHTANVAPPPDPVKPAGEPLPDSATSPQGPGPANPLAAPSSVPEQDSRGGQRDSSRGQRQPPDGFFAEETTRQRMRNAAQAAPATPDNSGRKAALAYLDSETGRDPLAPGLRVDRRA
jgi:hypothetical protein